MNCKMHGLVATKNAPREDLLQPFLHARILVDEHAQITTVGVDRIPGERGARRFASSFPVPRGN